MSSARFPIRSSAWLVALIALVHALGLLGALTLPRFAGILVVLGLLVSAAMQIKREAEKSTRECALEADDAGHLIWIEAGRAAVAVTGGRVLASHWIALWLAPAAGRTRGGARLLGPGSVDAAAYPPIARAILHGKPALGAAGPAA